MYIQSRNMFDCELKKIPTNLMHKDCMGLPQLELACCWYDPCQQGWEKGSFVPARTNSIRLRPGAKLHLRELAPRKGQILRQSLNVNTTVQAMFLLLPKIVMALGVAAAGNSNHALLGCTALFILTFGLISFMNVILIHLSILTNCNFCMIAQLNWVSYT